MKVQTASRATKFGKLFFEISESKVRIIDCAGNFAADVKTDEPEEFVHNLCTVGNIVNFLSSIYGENWVISVVKSNWKHIGGAIGVHDEAALARHSLVNTIGDRYVLRNN